MGKIARALTCHRCLKLSLSNPQALKAPASQTAWKMSHECLGLV